jgi:hypothetical protein
VNMRMWAIVIHASAEATDFSKSLANLRHRPSHAKVRSTTQRVARIAAIGEDMKQPWPSVPDGFQEIRSAVAILNIGTVHHEADNQPECIDDDVALEHLCGKAKRLCHALDAAWLDFRNVRVWRALSINVLVP